MNQTMDFSNMDSIDFNQTIMTPQHSSKNLGGGQGFNYDSHIREVPQTNANRYMERDMFADDISMNRSMMSMTQNFNPMQLEVNRQMTAQDQDRLLMEQQHFQRMRQQQRF